MINIDASKVTYDIESTTVDRNRFRPLEGFRRNLNTAVDTKMCTPYGPDS